MPGLISQQELHNDEIPGPAMPPFDGDHKIQQHSMCPLMNLIECNRGSFDGYSLEENQERIDLSLGKAVLSDRLNVSYLSKWWWSIVWCSDQLCRKFCS